MAVVDAPATDEILSIHRIARSLNLNVATIARMEARGDFPKSLKLGVRKKLYLLSAVQTWWKTVLGGQNGAPFPLAPADDADDDE
jgi:predicted DNA-binding transcriptional regulator AlpA